MHLFATSKNVKWCHLIWPTLYSVKIDVIFGVRFERRKVDKKANLHGK